MCKVDLDNQRTGIRSVFCEVQIYGQQSKIREMVRLPLRLSLYCSAGYSHFAMFKASFRGGRGCASPAMPHHTQQRRLYCTNVRILLREWHFYLGVRLIPNGTCDALSHAQLSSCLVVEKLRGTLICQTVTGCQ